MRKLLISLLIVAAALTAEAQDYQTGIGFRGGLSNGLTVKHFIKSDVALEGLLTARWQGFNITGLYEWHAPAFSAPGLYWYYGAGAHLGFWEGYSKHPWFKDDKNYSVLGIDGIIGIEYNIGEIPFNISLDWKPALNIIGHTNFWGDELAFSVRYVFGNR